MTLVEFNNTPFAARIGEELNRLKEIHWLKYDTEDLKAAIYFAFLNISGTELREDVDESLNYYVKNFNDVMKLVLMSYFKIDEKDYLFWFNQRYDPYTNSLRLNQECGLLTATYADNKDSIH